MAVIKQETLNYAMSLGRVVYLTRLEYKRMLFFEGVVLRKYIIFLYRGNHIGGVMISVIT